MTGSGQRMSTGALRTRRLPIQLLQKRRVRITIPLFGNGIDGARMIDVNASVHLVPRKGVLGDSFYRKAFVVFLSYVIFLVLIPSRGAETISRDDGLNACHDGSTAVTLVGYHVTTFTPRIHEAQSPLSYETKGILKQSPFVPNHLYRGPPVHCRSNSPVMSGVA